MKAEKEVEENEIRYAIRRMNPKKESNWVRRQKEMLKTKQEKVLRPTTAMSGSTRSQSTDAGYGRKHQ